jgi:putative membrane protein
MIDWSSWRNEPVLIAGLVLLGWGYGLLAGPLRPRLAPGEPFPRRPAVWFYAGLVLLYLALASPLDRVGRYFLLTAHTAQYCLLLYPAPVCLLLGLPAWMVDPAFRGAWRRRAGRLLLQPLLCGAAFILVVSAAYLPRIFEGSLRSDGYHQVQHALFVAVALLFWWPLLSPSRACPPIHYGARLLYLFVVVVAQTGVFTYLLMADHAMYPTYERAPRLIAALTPAEDQTLAGVILSLVSSLVLVGALGANFYRWAQTDRPPQPRP